MKRIYIQKEMSSRQIGEEKCFAGGTSLEDIHEK
jgi:hypothetical protein